MDELMYIGGQCRFCGKEVEVEVPIVGYWKWQEGELIQYAMPEVDMDTREYLISGMCPECQKDFFGEDEEEDEEQGV